MTKQVALGEISPLMEEILQSGGEVAFVPGGNSMRPMLRHRQDKIILVQAPAQLEKYDIPLYRRANGQFVLHRVVAVRGDGYVLCGDNQTRREYGIRHRQVVAVVKAFYRRGQYIDCRTGKAYRFYCRVWVALLPLRRLFHLVRALAGRVRGKHFAR